MKKLIANYHTHTYRCGHAAHCDDSLYVDEAIKNNLKVLGFSDHAPFKNLIHQGMRMEFNELEDYVSSINHLKKLYKDKIEIYVGLEIEYYEDKENYYKELKEKYGIEYLILGQHCYYDVLNNCHTYGLGMDDIEGIKHYKNDLIKGIKSKHFLYVCHPDLFMNHVSKITPEIDKVIEEICLCAKENNIPLEININGEIHNRYEAIKRGSRHYPDPYFFKKAKEYGNKFIFGIDAHNPELINEIPYLYFINFLNETGIEESDILDKIEIKNRRKK